MAQLFVVCGEVVAWKGMVVVCLLALGVDLGVTVLRVNTLMYFLRGDVGWIVRARILMEMMNGKVSRCLATRLLLPGGWCLLWSVK